MSKIDKKLKAMKTNPKNDWQISDLKSIAKQYSIEYRQPGTSHVTFSSNHGLYLTVPAHKPIKPIYIKRFVELIESLNEENIL
ncbi:MAG: type II toxin-antitoxin system HicA family toxin [Alphaproteobacteria bacterium]|nr:type II toxin-antitoxin system HicA family toxin [Alphaproteobacteria bacterium]